MCLFNIKRRYLLLSFEMEKIIDFLALHYIENFVFRKTRCNFHSPLFVQWGAREYKISIRVLPQTTNVLTTIVLLFTGFSYYNGPHPLLLGYPMSQVPWIDPAYMNAISAEYFGNHLMAFGNHQPPGVTASQIALHNGFSQYPTAAAFPGTILFDYHRYIRIFKRKPSCECVECHLCLFASYRRYFMRMTTNHAGWP